MVQEESEAFTCTEPGADPGILERGAVRGQSPEPSAEGDSTGGGGGWRLPQKILKNYV